MQDINQKTLLQSIKFEGVGLHSGVKAKVNILPAEDNHGIVFKRTDLKNNNIIKSNFKEVSSAKLCTTLKNKFGTPVSTIEHLMAAFYITGIDNVMVEINNSEIPIMDGSAIDFVNLINKAGLKRLHSKRKFLKILKKVEFKDGKKYISIEPNQNNFEVDFQLGYNNKIIGNQKNPVIFEKQDLKEIYSSRTFCLFEDIELIKKNGLAKGGSLQNAIVVKDQEILNPEGLRNDKEFVNHKILDCIGDLYTSGYRIIAKIKCSQGGHYITNQLLRKVFENKENFSILEIKEKNLPHTLINRRLLKSIA
jgi:UDP-3-O-[3-hydroxymyristoyl] N-acetylglucosamine deacetylase